MNMHNESTLKADVGVQLLTDMSSNLLFDDKEASSFKDTAK